jgi:hypothetical protein
MGIVQIIKTQFEFADRCEPTGRCRQSVEDPIPDPEPAAPSLGYPDPEIFHHPSCVYAETVLNAHIEHQQPTGPAVLQIGLQHQRTKRS